MAEYLAENSRLRQLSRRYADGQLSLEDYREARRDMLEALEAGRLQSVTEPAAEEASDPSVFAATNVHLPDDSSVFYKTMPPRVPVPADGDAAPVAAEPASWDSNTQMLAAVLGVALLIALVALVYVFVL